MATTITVELDDEANKLVGIFKEANRLNTKAEAVNAIIKKAKALILEGVTSSHE